MSACPSGYTCTAVGTVVDCTVGDAAGIVTFTALNASDTTGLCPALKAFVSETDWHCEVPVTSLTGGGQYAGAGCVLSQSDADFSTPDPKAYCWYSDGRVRAKYDVGRAGQVSAISSALSLPVTVATEYDDGTNSWVCGYKSGSDFVQVGTTQTALAFNSGVRGAFASSYSITSTLTAVTGPWEDTTTRDPYVDDPPPPDPDPTSDLAPYDDQLPDALVVTFTDVPIANNAALTAATLQCGRRYILAAGTYATDRTISLNCDEATPIQFAGTGLAGGWTTDITGKWALLGTNATITGMDFVSQWPTATVQLKGIQNRLIANRALGFIGSSSWIAPGGTAARGEIAFNEFGNPGPYTLQSGAPFPACSDPGANSVQHTQMTVRGADQGPPNFHFDLHIHDNYWHNFPEKPCSGYQSGQNDIVEPITSNFYAWSATVDTGWYIERNVVFLHEGGDGLIDIKGGGAVVYRNSFIGGTTGRVDSRGGTIHPNYFWSNNLESPSAGFVIHGNGHSIVGNCVPGGIKLVTGTDAPTAANTGSASEHSSAANVFLAGNTGNISTESRPFGGQSLIPIANTTIYDHAGTISLPGATGTVTNAGAAPGLDFIDACVPANKLDPEDVGPGALSGASTIYKQNRGLQ